MAYNLQPLITILEQILNPQQSYWILDNHDKEQLKSLLEKAGLLQQILEKPSLPKIESLESKIRDAAHQAEDIIEPLMLDQSCFDGMIDLKPVMQDLDSVMEQVEKLVEGTKMSSGGSSQIVASDPSSESVVVGVEDDLMKLKDQLTNSMRKRIEVVPIIGMGGVGKTTLARKLYEDTLIVSHFQYLAWTTISQDYDMKAIFLSLLSCIIGKDQMGQHIGKGSAELKDILYKRLFGRRYMIVLDDVWNKEAWDEMRRYFPDNSNGSRILITTRDSDVARHADPRSLHHEVQLLSEPDSWNLLRKIVFGEEDCPDVLMGIGRKIASDCGGLPLAINVIGGLLSKLGKSEDDWENIGDDVRAAIANLDEQFSNILSLSYSHLPNHLKPCFLYMGAFPEDYVIKASRLISMWIAEGFVKSNGDRSLEEEAKDYLKGLVDRNLVLVENGRVNGKVKNCSMHDLLRDVCMRKAYEEKFLHVVSDASEVSPSNMRRVSISAYTSQGMEDEEVMRLARSLLCTSSLMLDEVLFPVFSVLRFLRVLDVIKISFEEFPIEIFQLVNLRYLSFWCKSSVPGGLSRLWKLQTLIADIDSDDVPPEIWNLCELRYLKLTGLIFFEDGFMFKNFIHNHLHTLSLMWITPLVVRNGLFESIPNIKVMGIHYDAAELPSTTIDLSHLHKLETLNCESNLDEDCCRYLPSLKFPSSLRKLTLFECAIFPSVMRRICTLPNLQVLEIVECKFQSEMTEEDDDDDDDEEEEEEEEEWCMGEEDVFQSLEFLRLQSLTVVRWRADETNFPRLRSLIIGYCTKLEEIPSGIGEISTIQLIEMYECSASAVDSAKQIQEVQQSEYDNYDLKLRITEKVEEEEEE